MRKASLLVPLLVAACHQNLTMSDQRRLDEYERSTIFRNGKVLQSPPPGSISREQDLGNLFAEKPMMSLALVERGRKRFNIFCSECHGPGGDGDGMVVQRGFPRPPRFDEARLLKAPDDYFVEVITNGHGAMYSYADRVPPADRWAIAAYIRALQRVKMPAR
ncbi:MAG TPA: cytochrome c [Sphingomicrobium sp.]|jgi:mono/diheme cytochrome c family protein|nr:cytochrome c [Sphingomicrobium sp.]